MTHLSHLSLIQLVNNEKTDKNTVHSYLSLYESLLKNKRNTCLFLEINGVWHYKYEENLK